MVFCILDIIWIVTSDLETGRPVNWCIRGYVVARFPDLYINNII